VPGIVLGEVPPAFGVFALSTSRVSQHLISREQMATATVKWFSEEKGFGLITPVIKVRKLFVHSSEIAGGGRRSHAKGANVSDDAAPQGAERHERADDLTPDGYSHLWTARLKRTAARQNTDIYGHWVGRLGWVSGLA
jgi:CspA family cold shock protein